MRLLTHIPYFSRFRTIIPFAIHCLNKRMFLHPAYFSHSRHLNQRWQLTVHTGERGLYVGVGEPRRFRFSGPAFMISRLNNRVCPASSTTHRNIIHGECISRLMQDGPTFSYNVNSIFRIYAAPVFPILPNATMMRPGSALYGRTTDSICQGWIMHRTCVTERGENSKCTPVQTNIHIDEITQL